MRFKIYGACLVLTVLFFALVSYALNRGEIENVKAATADVSVQTDISDYLAITVNPNSVDFDTLSPGMSADKPTNGIVVGVTTNAANGYTLALSDGVSGSNSCLVHTDGVTYIADAPGLVTLPEIWSAAPSMGLGITMFSAETPNVGETWELSDTYNSSSNKYAGIPENVTIAHTVTGVISGEDTSSWSFKLEVDNDQKTGTYSGQVTFTALGQLS